MCDQFQHLHDERVQANDYDLHLCSLNQSDDMEITKVKGRTHCFDRFMLIKRPPFIGNVDLIRDICRDLFKNNIACKEIFVLFVWISNFVERVDAGSPQTLNQRKIGFRLN